MKEGNTLADGLTVAFAALANGEPLDKEQAHKLKRPEGRGSRSPASWRRLSGSRRSVSIAPPLGGTRDRSASGA